MNNCTFVGRLARDPELRPMPSGQTVATLQLDVSVWGRQAKRVASYLSKGSECVVSGKVDVQISWRRDGSKEVALTLNADNITFVGVCDQAGRQQLAADAAQAQAA